MEPGGVVCEVDLRLHYGGDAREVLRRGTGARFGCAGLIPATDS